MRLRIAAAFGIGIVIIGILAWPMVEHHTPFDAVSFAAGTVSVADAIILALLAFIAAIAAYFLCWPWGREIAVTAAPAGLAIWAIRSGNMAQLITENPSIEQQKLLFDALRFEPLAWLAVVAAGFAGVGLCDLFLRSEAKETKGTVKGKSKEKTWKPSPYSHLFGPILGPIIAEKMAAMREKMQQNRAGKPVDERKEKGNKYVNGVLAVLASVIIAQFCIRIFAQDRAAANQQMDLVAAQPAIGQIVFGVWISFGLAAFAVKKFLRAGYIYPVIASGVVTAFGIFTYMKHDTMAYLVEHWPPVFYSNAIMSILPVQMVAFGVLGSIWGYWMAVKFIYWREHSQTE